MNAVVDAALFGVLTISSVLLFLPQLVRLIRSGDVSGLSAASLLFGVVNYLAWNVYLGDSREWGLLAVNVLASAVWIAVTALALHRLRPTKGSWAVVPWALLVTGAVLLDRAALGFLLAVGTLLSYGPQAVGVWRAPSVSGISPVTWSIAAVEGLAWFAASLPGHLFGGLVFGAVSTFTAISVLTAVAVRRGTGSVRSHAGVDALAEAGAAGIPDIPELAAVMVP